MWSGYAVLGSARAQHGGIGLRGLAGALPAAPAGPARPRRTPLCRFGVPAAQLAPTAQPIAEPSPQALAFVEDAITSCEQPVVMLVLERCEFSWSVRRFLRDLGVSYRSVDLDSVAMQGISAEIRRALHQRTGQPTIPQVFIGGASDVLARHDRGELLPLLTAEGIMPTGTERLDALGYLPKWLAARPAA